MKKYLKIMFLAFAGLAIGFNVYNSQKGIGLSDLALSNIEALASSELGLGDCMIYNCYWHPEYDCHVYQWGIYKGVCSGRRG